MSAPRWWAGGLRFSCRRCGACCTGTPGFVRVGPAEAAAIAAWLGMSAAVFARRHTRPAPGGASLREEADGSCEFHDPAAGCRIYPVRPGQCRSWPFWPRLLADRRAWEREAAACPGMGAGALHDAARIERLAFPEAAGALPRRRDSDYHR